jgi:hypothetical protein
MPVNRNAIDSDQRQIPGILYSLFYPLIYSPPMRSSINGPVPGRHQS